MLLCRATHQFSMAIQPRLSELKRKEEEGIILILKYLITKLYHLRLSIIPLL